MKKVIIIGGGVAGLSAGIYGQMAGYETEIYEKHSIAGGECTGWKREGYTIDNCIHWLTGTKKGTEIYRVWEELGVLGQEISLVENDWFYTVEHQDQHITFWRDKERTRREMLELSPEDAAEINAFIEAVSLSESGSVPAEKPMDLMKVSDYIKLGKSMAGTGKAMKQYGGILLEEMAERFRHPLLKAAFSIYMPKGYSAYSMIFSYATFTSGQGDIPSGGSLAMAERMRKRYESLGGKLYTNREAARIELEQGKGRKARGTGITFTDGSIAEADYFICACDMKFTFSKLLPAQSMDRGLIKCYEKRSQYPVSSSVQAAFAVEGSCPEMTGTRFFSCRELTVAKETCEMFSVKSYSYEPAFAPAGCTVLQTSVSQFEDSCGWWEELSKDQAAYQAEKKRLGEVFVERITEHCPQLKGRIRVLDVWTPVTYERYLNAYRGSYMGFIMKPGNKMKQYKGTVKGIDNVFLASQWQQSPGGLPTAAVMGKFAVMRLPVL